MITLVVPPDLLAEDRIELSGHKYRHLFRARRLANGERVRLVDGRGKARSSRVTQVSRQSAQLELGTDLPANEPECRITLLASVPKPSRLAWMVEKVTEMGVNRVRLLRSQHGPRRVGKATLERLKRVSEAAVEQSHRSVVPEISGPHDWQEVPDMLADSTERWVLLPSASGPLDTSNGADVALVVGPEGGFTSSECEELAKWGCRSARLGPTTLRIETAAVVACGIVVHTSVP